MILPCVIPQLDIPDLGRNHILNFFLVPVRKIMSVQEINSDSLFVIEILNSYIICVVVAGPLLDSKLAISSLQPRFNQRQIPLSVAQCAAADTISLFFLLVRGVIGIECESLNSI